MKYRPKLDPKVDLKGATPETLARALLRRKVPKRKVAGACAPAGDDATAQGAVEAAGSAQAESDES